MHYKDNFEDATSRIEYAHSVVHNAGYHRSDRDLHLAQRLRQLVDDIKNSRGCYDDNGNLILSKGVNHE
jgi:hypothetical protein